MISALGVIPLKNSPQPSMLKKIIELSYRIHLKFNLSDTHMSWKGYLIGSLTPKINIQLMAYQKNRQSEDVYRQKSYFHFRFSTNSGGFFPIRFIFYLTMQESIFCLRTTFPCVLFDWYPCLVVIHLRAMQICFFNLFFVLFIFIYQYPVKTTISGVWQSNI